MHENLPVVAADERPLDGGSLHFRPGTALEDAFPVKILCPVKIFQTRLIQTDLRNDRFAHLFFA
jgi:hypothetical protein